MGAISDDLIRMARAVVDSVLSGLTQQLNIVEQAAMTPIKAMVQQVVNGIWIGNGANAFVNEVSSLVIPGVTQISSHITGMTSNITKAREIIDQADQATQNLVKSQLHDAFGFF